MTQALESALSKLAQLPPADQDRIGLWLLDELADEEKWASNFAASQDGLAKLAAEARMHMTQGTVTDIDGKL